VRTTRLRFSVALLCAVVVAAAAGGRHPLRAAAADFTRYHTYAELTAALKAAVAAHPDLAKLVSIGKTREGRDIWAVEIAKPSGTPADARPGLLIAANFEGDHLIGSELALFTVDFLLGAYATDAAVKQRLDRSVVYVVPRVNADGAEQMFAPVKALRRTNTTPFDADNDGRVDEDGPEDLNKDGVVTVMRVKDPKGPYMVSPDDARLMKRADPAKGESGGWALYVEGVDNDGDGFYNEDGAGGVDLNRNFMHQYPYYTTDAGRYMASETETRALLDYVLAHRNIAAILTFGESDNLITAGGRPAAAAGLSLVDVAERANAPARRVGVMPDLGGATGRFGGRGGGGRFMFGDEGAPSAGRGAQTQPAGRGGPGVQPATTVNAADLEYFNAIGAKYRELTGLRTNGFVRTPAGAFFEYGYFQYGVPSFSTPGWGLPGGGRPGGPGGGAAPSGEAVRPAGAPAGIPGTAGATGAFGQRGAGRGAGAGGGAGAEGDVGEGIDLRLLQWMDSEKVDGFVAWAPFKHPSLGDVEIGGFKPYVTVNPPAAKIAELGATHAKFVVHLTSLFARVTIAKTEVTALGGGLFRIRADVENAGFLPTALAQGVTARSAKPVMVQLGVAPESIITGSEKTNHIPALAGSGSRQSYEWVIKGTPGSTVTLKAVSQKGGTDTAALTLK
jgi:hypothetical protein